MAPQPDAEFDKRIKFDRLVLREGEHPTWCRRSAMRCASRSHNPPAASM
jgi:hypothetical protein